MTKRHVSPSMRDNILSQSWFVYLNLALTISAFAALYFYLPAKRECQFLSEYNSSQLTAPIYQRDGDVLHKIIVITDLDHDSKDKAKKDTWSSILKTGILTISADQQKASVEWDDEHEISIYSQIAAGGRSISSFY
jgi:hypothetical protein